MSNYDWMMPDPKREGAIMCRFCYRQIQRCICSGPNDMPLDTGPNAIGDGVALNSASHPDEFAVRRISDAIKDGRLSLTRKQK